MHAVAARVLVLMSQILYGWDLLVLSECKALDHHFWRTLRAEWGVEAEVVFRPPEAHGVTRAADSGGVAVVNFSPSRFRINRIAADPLGVLAVRVLPRGVAARPFILMGAYVPPISSEFAPWTPHILQSMARIWKLLRTTYGNDMLLAGDLNMQLEAAPPLATDPRPRYIAYSPSRANAARRRVRELRELFTALDATPVHGRTAAAPARRTSRAIRYDARGAWDAEGHAARDATGYAESEYIIAPQALGEDRVTAGPVQPWAIVDAVSEDLTHCALTITLQLRPSEGPAAAEPARQPRRKLPPYSSPLWYAMWDQLNARLCGANTPLAALLSDPAAPAAAAATAVAAAIVEAADAALPPPAAAAGGEGAFVRRRRLYQGLQLPRNVVQLLKRKRRAWRAAKRDGQCNAPELKALRQEARRETRRFARGLAAQRGHLAAELMRRHEPSALWHKVIPLLAPENYLLCSGKGAVIPDEANHPPAGPRFREAMYQQLGVEPPLPFAAGDHADPLAAMLAHYFRSFIPFAAGEQLKRPFTAEEVMMSIFPVMKRLPLHRCPADGTPAADCRLCSHFRAAHAAWDGSSEEEAPDWTPCLKTSKASGDDLSAELLRWARTEAEGDRLEARRRVGEVLAALFNKILAEGALPAELAHYRTIMLLKGTKPGVQPNLADPDCYRPITLSPLLTKILGIMLAARLYHWATRNGLIGPSQIGFMPHHGADWHVFTLTEAIRARWREKLPTYVLFVDIRKAYDSVHPAALLSVLEAMGVPPELISLLRSWSAQRRTTVYVNGEPTLPIDVRNGVGQGDVLSPLLFNLFIESLQRFLEATLPGISAAGVTIRSLFYADDIAIPCASPEAVAAALTAVEAWMTAWGLKIGVGRSKTAAVPFPVHAARAAVPAMPAVPLTAASGEAVPWAEEYTYLGATLRWNLDSAPTLKRLTALLDGNTHRFLGYNSFIPHTNAALAFQVLSTAIIGAGNYLLALMEPNAELVKLLNSRIVRAARHILPVATAIVPEAAMWLDGRAPHALGLLMRERARLFHALSTSAVPSALAPRLFAALVAQAVGAHAAAGAPLAHRSWVVRSAQVFVRMQLDLQVPLPAPATPLTGAREAAKYGRAVGYTAWFTSLQQVAEGVAPVGWPHSARPAGGPPLRHIADSLGPRVPDLGDHHAHTPLSARGPLCSGNLLAYCNVPLPRHEVARLLALRVGRAGFFFFPLAPTRWVVERLLNLTTAEEWRLIKRPAPCPTCAMIAGANAPTLSDWHIINECPSTYIVQLGARAVMPQRVALVATALLIANHRALPGARFAPPYPPGLPTTVAEYRREAEAADWTSPYGQFLLYRFVTLQPWEPLPPSAEPYLANDAAFRLATRLGLLFHSTNVAAHHLRRVARAWAPWAVRFTSLHVDAWTTAAAPLQPSP